MRAEQPTYWQRYDKLFKHFSSRAIYNKILEVANKLGKPFTKKGKRGPKFKIKPEEYAAYEAYKIISSNASFRDMELDSDLFLDKHLDHGTFHNNFLRIPYEYLNKLLSEIARMLEDLLGYFIATIFDSTGLTTSKYEETIVKGKLIRRNKDYKLHTITAYHPKEKITYYIDALSSDKHVSDAEGASRLLKRNKTSGFHLGDRAYDAEKVYKEILANEGIPIIKPKKHKAKLFSDKAKGRTMYREHIYKELRGIIETSYGGLENKGLTNTRCVRDDSIKKKGMLAAIRHNFMTYLRLLAIQIGRLSGIIRQTLFFQCNRTI